MGPGVRDAERAGVLVLREEADGGGQRTARSRVGVGDEPVVVPFGEGPGRLSRPG